MTGARTPTVDVPVSETEDDSEPKQLHTVVLNVQSEPTAACGLRFEDHDWRALLPMLRPLGLAMGTSRQPPKLRCKKEDSARGYDLSVSDLLQAFSRRSHIHIGFVCDLPMYTMHIQHLRGSQQPTIFLRATTVLADHLAIPSVERCQRRGAYPAPHLALSSFVPVRSLLLVCGVCVWWWRGGGVEGAMQRRTS